MLAKAAEEESVMPGVDVMKSITPPRVVKGANTIPLGDASLKVRGKVPDATLTLEKSLNSLEVVNFWQKTLRPRAVGEKPELPAKVVPPQTLSENPKIPVKVVKVVLPPSCTDKPQVKTKVEEPTKTGKTTKNSLKRPYAEFSRNAEHSLPPKPLKVMPPKVAPPQPLEGVRKTIGLGPAPSPNTDTKSLLSLLQYRELAITLKTFDGDGRAQVRVSRMQISGAGLRQHEVLAHHKELCVLPISIRDPNTSLVDGTIHRSVDGQLLEDVWAESSTEMKHEYAKQLRKIIGFMRGLGNLNRQGSAQCGNFTLLLDKHTRHTYYAVRQNGVVKCSKLFLAFLMSSLYPTVSDRVAQSLIAQFPISGKPLLAHSNLCPRNIIVKDGKIEWIAGWDCAG